MARKKAKDTKPKTGFQVFLHFLGNAGVYAAFGFLIVCLLTAIQYRDNPTEAYVMGYRPVFVKTGSMEPTINVNSLLLVKQIEYDDVNEGDIILFESGEKAITHRVIKKTGEGIQTKGDNNNSADPYILKEENVKGRVVMIMNWMRIPMNDICPEGFGNAVSWKGILKWIGLPVFLILIIEAFISCMRKIDDDEDEEEEKPKKEKTKKKSRRHKETDDGNLPDSPAAKSPEEAESFPQAAQTNLMEPETFDEPEEPLMPKGKEPDSQAKTFKAASGRTGHDAKAAPKPESSVKTAAVKREGAESAEKMKKPAARKANGKQNGKEGASSRQSEKQPKPKPKKPAALPDKPAPARKKPVPKEAPKKSESQKQKKSMKKPQTGTASSSPDSTQFVDMEGLDDFADLF